MAKFETVPIGELKHRLPAKLLPLVEEYREKLERFSADQGGRLTLEKFDDPEGSPASPQGGGDFAQPPDPIPVPWGRRVAELLSRGQAGSTGPAAGSRRGRSGRRGATAEAGKAEEGGQRLSPREGFEVVTEKGLCPRVLGDPSGRPTPPGSTSCCSRSCRLNACGESHRF
jgi:hypothetical protein